jgi:hypothetical protein
MLPRIGDIDLTYSADNPHSEEQKNLFNEIQTADINYYFGNFTDLFNDSLIEEIIKLKNLLSKNYDKLQDNENINNINRWLILLEDVLKYTPSRLYRHIKKYFIHNTPWPEIMYYGYKLKDAISLLKPEDLLEKEAIDWEQFQKNKLPNYWSSSVRMCFLLFTRNSRDTCHTSSC